MQAQSIHRSFVVVDVEGYGGRPSADQRWLRKQMYDVVHTALTNAGIAWSDCVAVDRGDGIILIVPASTPRSELTDAFTDRLELELARYGRRSRDAVRMRMRVALHAGEVAEDEQGWVGADLNTACRLVDLDEARRTLRGSPAANLVLVISNSWHSAIVAQDPDLAGRFDFRRVPFVAKEIDDHAWLHIRTPREQDAPRDDPAVAAGPTSGTEPAIPTTSRADGPSQTPPSGMHFNGAVRATNIVHGTQFNSGRPG